MKLSLGCLYRPPSSDLISFRKDLEEAINKCPTHSDIVLVGDFNAKSPEWLPSDTSNVAGRELAPLFLQLGLHQCVSTPTRIHADGRLDSLLDLVLTNAPQFFSSTKTLPPLGSSDHLCIICDLNFPVRHKIHRTSKRRRIWRYDKVNFNVVNTALKNADWDQALNTEDIDAAFSTWTSIYLGMIKKLFPSKVVKQVKPKTRMLHRWRRNVSFSISASLSLFSALTLYSHAHLWSMKLSLGCLYRPPSSDLISFRKDLEEAINKCPTHSDIVLVGDFNAKSPEWLPSDTSNVAGRELAPLFLQLGLHQCVSTPTRIHADGRLDSLLDLVLTNAPQFFSSTKTLPPLGSSDHLCIICDLNFPVRHKIHRTSKRRRIWRYDKVNFNVVNTALKNADWDQALNTEDIDAAFSTWTSIYLGMIKKLIPSKVVKQVKPKTRMLHRKSSRRLRRKGLH